MARTIIVDGGEKIACPKCNHGFPLSEGISRQTIDRYADEFERSVAAHRKKLEAELAAEAKAQFDSQRKALNEALGAKEGDRKSTRLNSSHEWISYAVFCLKKKKREGQKHLN